MLFRSPVAITVYEPVSFKELMMFVISEAKIVLPVAMFVLGINAICNFYYKYLKNIKTYINCTDFQIVPLYIYNVEVLLFQYTLPLTGEAGANSGST